MRIRVAAVTGLAVAGSLLWGASSGTLHLPDVDGTMRSPLAVLGQAAVLIFVATDCPISNFFAPEIQAICGEYGTKGVSCSLVYEDVQVDSNAVHKHMADFQYHGFPAFIDAKRTLSNRLNATVTPEAVVLDHAGKVRYRGRVNNFYADLGKPRRQATVHDLRDALDAVLAGKPVAVPETRAVGCYIVNPDVLKN